LPQLIARYAPYFAHCHANDTNLRAPGFGETDFRPILKALQSFGYEGYISVEPFDYKPDPETIATKSLEYLKACMQEGGAEGCG
jgi:sugar phosphate isomerase/epimerase